MIELHANDDLGRTANEAALAAHKLDLFLLGAASRTMSRKERAECAERAFRLWFPLCRAMSKLEQVAPNAAARARQTDLKVQDFVEGRG